MHALSRFKELARRLKQDVLATWLAARDPRVPWYAKAVALAVAAYALSPIDLIPDFIPVLGYLDDLIVVPAGILLVQRMVPAELMAEHRRAAAQLSQLPSSRAGAGAIVIIWAVLTAAFVSWIASRFILG